MAITAGQIVFMQGNASDCWDMKILTPEQGDLFYFDGTNLNVLAHGTAGQYLKTGGHAANPSWESRPPAKRVYSTTSLATLTPEIASYDLFHLTAQAEALTIANHSTSTPTDGEQMKIRLLDNGTPRAITYGTNYVAKAGVALPTTTIASKNLEMMFEWNANLSKWNLMATGQEA